MPPKGLVIWILISWCKNCLKLETIMIGITIFDSELRVLLLAVRLQNRVKVT